MRISSRQLEMFYVQLGTMIESGVPIQQALRSQEKTVAPRLRSTVARWREWTEQGHPLHEAMGLTPGRIAEFDRQTLQICEQSGTLDKGLLSLGQYHQKRGEAIRRIVGITILPVILLVAAVFVPRIPKLVLAFMGQGEDTMGAFFMDTAGWLASLVFGVAGMFWLAQILLRHPATGPAMDWLLNAIPLFGGFRKAHALSVWAQQVRMMLAAGHGVVPAMENASRFSPSPLIAAAFPRIKPFINSQLEVSEVLAGSGVFPPMFCQLWSAGERSGRLDEMLDRLSRHFEDEWRRKLAQLAVALPFFIYLLVSGFIIMQIFKMMGSYVRACEQAIDFGM
ncbi:MAG: type II secretion system F family protein [Verrucomicrobiae bacterium]|nr:type II secretion system F family protein [Verrucomicrobiae bacterium]